MINIELLKEKLKQKNINQRELAEILEIKEATVSAWKRGYYPQVQTLIKMCKILEVSADELLELETKPDQPDEITQDEKKLLEHYRKSNEQGKISIMSLAELQSSLNSPNETLSNLNVG